MGANNGKGHEPCAYQTLVEFMAGTATQGDDVESFYHALDGLLRGNFHTGKVMVCSTPRPSEEKKDLGPYFRSHWNRDALESAYSQEEVLALINSKERERELSSHTFAGRPHRVMFMGEDEGQLFFLAFAEDSARPLVEHFCQVLERYIQSSFEIYKKLAGLGRLRSLVHIDDVTGLYNQRKLAKDLEKQVRRFEESKTPFAVLFIDIDHFKQVNDGHGHLIGTQLLSDMARLMRRVLRESDLIYRYGGDEFVMLLPNASIENARRVGERLLRAVKAECFSVAGAKKGPSPFKLSVSIGIASVPEDAKGAQEILEMADKMMYHAKTCGRGRVCHAGEIFE